MSPFTMNTIISGQYIKLTEWVGRITAPNPGLMTGAGTNTYLVGKQSIAVIDPGPLDDSHIQAIVSAGAGRIKWIFVTHTHNDHSPAAQRLAELTGAKIYGNLLAADDGHQDALFQSHGSFTHDQSFSTNEITLRVLHTPGHVDNHLCYLLEEEGFLFTGDHIMQGSTVVIIPPYGDMQAYISSLQLLLGYSIKRLGPGHGEVIDKPRAEIQRLITHRQNREQKVLACLSDKKAVTLLALTERVYDDVAPTLYPLAKLSLWAHLIKLEQEALVVSDGEHWCLQ